MKPYYSDDADAVHADSCNFRPTYCGPNATRDGSEVIVPGRWCTCGAALGDEVTETSREFEAFERRKAEIDPTFRPLRRAGDDV